MNFFNSNRESTFSTTIVLTVLCLNLVDSGSIRYCIPRSKPSASIFVKKACERLLESQDEIRCVMASDRLECLKLLLSHRVDFMVAEPEDLTIMRAKNVSDIVVTHQLRKFARRSSQRDVEMIVIVRSDTGDYSSKGKKLCYIGLDSSHISQYDYYYTSYFESWLFPSRCDSDKTYLENRIVSLSEHFHSACIAGPWSLDERIDAELKNRYKNLCKLCDNPETCDDTDRYHGMNGAIACLTQGIGDIAWLNRADATSSFAQLAAYDYKLLCPDGTMRSLNDTDVNTTCTWIKDPRPVIITDKNMGQLLLETIADTGSVGSRFYQVIHASYKFSYLQKMDRVTSMSDYLLEFPGYYSASVKVRSSCPSKRKLRWCVTSKIEYDKCESLLQASEALELGLRFECILSQSREDCIRAISSKRYDFFVATPAEVYRAKRSALKSIIHLMASDRDESNNIAAIVKRGSPFKTFADLKGARACFPGYGSVGWKAFFLSLKDITEAETSCDDMQTISLFFNQSCVANHQNEDTRLPQNLYSLCKNDGSNLGTDEKAFKCLADGGDVAFVNVGAAKAYSSHEVIFNTRYKLLCPNPSKTSTPEESCTLARMNLGAVIVHENLTKVDEDDTHLVFTTLNRYFGKTFTRETPTFRMFEPFDGVANVIFSDATMGLERVKIGQQRIIYTEDLESLTEIPCVDSNNGSFTPASGTNLICLLLIVSNTLRLFINSPMYTL